MRSQSARMLQSTLMAGVLLALLEFGLGHAQEVPAGVVMFNSANAKWMSQAGTPGGGTGPGTQSAAIYGDSSKPGPYSFLTKPASGRLGEGPSSRPHTHPDTRTYTVISGTWYVGFGTALDESKLIALPAGSYYTEPAGVPHFVLVKDNTTIVQISGTGPSRIIPVEVSKGK